MANQTNLSDDTYGIQSPDELLDQQAKAYEKAQGESRGMADRVTSAGLYGIQNMFGGGPAVNKARLVQARMQDIMQQVNANADPNEDPLTAQLRMSQAIARGMAGTDINVALRAQDQSVRLAQAAKQQSVLDLTMQTERQKLSDEQYASQIKRNTPQQMLLVKDLGKDANQLSLGYEPVSTYDLTEPDALSKMQAEIKAAQANGTTLQALTPEQLASSRVQVAAANGQARGYASLEAALARIQAAQTNAGKGSVVNDRFAMRMMGNTDSASDQLTAISELKFGTNTGWFAGIMGARDPGESLLKLSSEHLRRSLTSEDMVMYNTAKAGMDRGLAMLETQGGLQGGMQLAKQINDALTIQPEDAKQPMTIMFKLADARGIIDHNIAAYLHSSKADPNVVSYIQQQLDKMHDAVPFTRHDVIAYVNATRTDPGLTFQQFAVDHKLEGFADAQKLKAAQAPALEKDANGAPGTGY